jgi:hypothetical protein
MDPELAGANFFSPEAGKEACDFGLILSQAIPHKAKIFGEYIRKKKMDKVGFGFRGRTRRSYKYCMRTACET